MSGKNNAVWVVLGCLLFSLLWLHYATLKEAERISGWDSHTRNVINNNTRLLLSIIQAHSDQGDFLLSGNNSFLQSYYQTKKTALSQLETLKKKSNPEEKATLDSLVKLFNQRFDQLDLEISYRSQNQNTQLNEHISGMAGDLLMNDLDRLIRSINNREEQLLMQQKGLADRNITLTFILLITGLITIFLLIFIHFGRIRQQNSISTAEQKRKVHEREIRYKELTENMPGMFYSVDKNLRYIHWNKACEIFTGLKKEIVIGKMLEEGFPEHAGSDLASAYVDVLRSRKPKNYIEDFIFKDRRYVHELIIFPTAFGISVLRIDITEQKVGEEKIIKFDRLLTEAQQLANVGNWNYEIADKSFFCSEVLTDIYGLDKDFAPDFQQYISLIHPEDKQRVIARMYQEHQVGSSRDTYFRIIQPGGQIRILKGKSNAVRDNTGRTVRLHGVVQDVTEQKEAEENLVQIERLLSEAQQLAKVGNWNYDVVKNELFWSEGIRDTYGVDHDFNPSFDALLSMIIPEDRDRVVKKMMKAEETGEYEEDEYRIVRSDGQVRVLKALTRFTFNKEGMALRIFGISQDITELKRAQWEILEAIEHLQKRNKDLKQFGYFLSHVLRAPVAKILGITALFDSAGDIDTNSTLIKYISDEAASLDEIVKDINEIITSSNPDNAIKENILFEDELDLIKEVLSTEIAESEAVIISDFSKAYGIFTVKSYLYSILFNLISNSIKYRSTANPLRIHISTVTDPEYISITVQDNGTGIDLIKHKDKVFGLYKRFHGKEIEGKGIGLYLLKTQVESLGGHVEIESEPDRGTTVRVFLPINARINGNTKNIFDR